jgi:hypothetical protein
MGIQTDSSEFAAAPMQSKPAPAAANSSPREEGSHGRVGAVVPRSRIGAGPDDVSAARCDAAGMRGMRTGMAADRRSRLLPRRNRAARPRGAPRGRRSSSEGGRSGPATAEVRLYWLPLGAGGHSVRYNGRVFEWVAAHLAGRPVCALYHAALEVRTPKGRFVIEQAPVRRGDPALRGVVASGPVGNRWAGRLRVFRYEVRCWRDGVIPDLGEAVDSPRFLSEDPGCAERVLDLIPSVPTPAWGRDELRAGEMWNSNSMMSWVITRAGMEVESIKPPGGGRAPGWRAGIMVARRDQARASDVGLGQTARTPVS